LVFEAVVTVIVIVIRIEALVCIETECVLPYANYVRIGLMISITAYERELIGERRKSKLEGSMGQRR
jgi:hypothetical protein